jgi:hypothetical protein
MLVLEETQEKPQCFLKQYSLDFTSQNKTLVQWRERKYSQSRWVSPPTPAQV